MKNRMASSAIRPGKKRYMAFLKPMASPTCSTKMPRVPKIDKRDYVGFEIRSFYHQHLTRDDVHHKEEEGGADAPGVGRDDLHDDGEEDREPGLRKQIIQGWRRCNVRHRDHIRCATLEHDIIEEDSHLCLSLCLHIPRAMKQ